MASWLHSHMKSFYSVVKSGADPGVDPGVVRSNPLK